MPLDFQLPPSCELRDEITRNVVDALREDIGGGDLSGQLIPEAARAHTELSARSSTVLCGTAWFDACFTILDPDVSITWLAQEGDDLEPGQKLCRLSGNARALLGAERSGLNFLQMLCAVAARTRLYVRLAAVAGGGAHIVDTRKTLPGLRIAQKYAVHIGGGGNHRLALWDAILIKENHILAAGGIAAALTAASRVAEQADHCRFVQIEVESLDELQTALKAGARMVLLDNFSVAELTEAVTLNAGRAVLEASGGIDENTLPAIAASGVDRISVGSLTKDICAADLSMRFLTV